jgi:hypothetical protein
MAAALTGCVLPHTLAHYEQGGGDERAMAAPKRVGPAAVAPVVTNGIRIEALNASRKRGLPQNGGYLEAFDVASGNSLWLLRVYEIAYDGKMEEDVQDRFIEKLELKPDGENLLVTDEFGKRFEVNLRSRKVRTLP